MPPPLGSKGKGKVKDSRQSRSRNTTPSSVLSAPLSATLGANTEGTAYLEIGIGSLVVPTNVLYDDILERHGAGPGIPDPRHLEAITGDLRTLYQLAAKRETACDTGMRELSGRRKLRIEEDRELEQQHREASLKRAADDDEMERPPKGQKLQNQKKKARPLNRGAHEIARQDGLEVQSIPSRPSAHKPKPSTGSGSSSSLSPPSQAQSPTMINQLGPLPTRNSPTPSSSSDDDHQPPPAASIPQYQTFGANPLTFDDPTVYHIRDVTVDMTDKEKRNIYCVASFPHDDLRDLIAGTPPDRDFSNAKPTNQVNANTFATYLEPYFRPLTDEDMAFLKERGDRITPFVFPRRGTKSYQQVWAEEDGVISVDSHHGREKLPANQPRGTLDQLDDENAETDQVSGGPVLSRLLSTMRYEHRPEEKERSTTFLNGDTPNGLTNGDIIDHHEANNDGPPPATFFQESNTASWKTPIVKQDYVQIDDRLKTELRYMGFLGQDDEPDYDARYDDEVAQRLRFLQSELRKQMVLNGARKARLHQIAEEHMGYQEFTTIRDDLDAQVVQAFSKRNRTIGKGKKNVKRPGGAGGGSHFPGGAAAGVSKPGIGDMARTLMDRRRRWTQTVEPIFSDDMLKVRGEGDSIFKEEDMFLFIQTEKERIDEEAELG